MSNILSSLNKSSFIKNVSVMVIGTIGAQVIAMALSPIITRLYGPESFGIMGTFVALTQIIVTIAGLTYPIAIVLPQNDNNAKRLVKLSLYITTLIASILMFILFFFNDFIVRLLHIEEIAPFIFLVPVVILLAGVMQVSEQWLIRTNQFSVSAKANFLQSTITNGSKVGVGLIYPTAATLIILQALGDGIRAVLMFFLSRGFKSEKNSSNEKDLSLQELARVYRDFPLYRAPEVFISSASQNLPVLLLTIFFGPATAGFYNVGRIVLGLPSRLIGQAIGDVFYPRISKAANNGEDLNKLIKKATLALGAVGILPFSTIIFFGPFLFEFIFGEGWGGAGEYARWIALSSFAILMNKPSIRSMPVLKAQKFQLAFTIISLVVQTLALLIGFIVFESDLVAIALFGVSGFLLNITLIYITLKISKKFNV